MKTTVADFIADILFRAGVRETFLVTGGFSMPLTDAVGRQGQMKFVCTHHEQAAAMAGEACGRFTGRLGAVYVTAGPAATNALTGVVGAWVDSAPCIVIAGQAKLGQARVTGMRQFPVQGFETLPIYSLVTKYAVMLDDLKTVRYQLEKAIYLATHGRVGPVWVEVPLDLQSASFDPDETPGFDPVAEGLEAALPSDEAVRPLVREALALLKSAKRPAMILGAGVRHADGLAEMDAMLDQLKIPFVTSRLGMDLVDHQHPYFVGRPGTYGDRPANTTVQNSDVFLSIGCRLGIGLIGHDYQDFAPCSKKILVDVDASELQKPSLKAELAIHADAKQFIRLLTEEARRDNWTFAGQSWVDSTQTWKRRYPVDDPEYVNETEGVNSYHFTRVFSEYVDQDAISVLDTGSCFHVWAQAFQVKKGQRHIITGGLSTMGYGLPASIGVAAAAPGKNIICVTGDGSIQMNLQELQTIVHHQFPIKMIVFDNKGYLLIRLSQRNFHGGRLLGEGPKTGVSFPDPEKVAWAYGIKYVQIDNVHDMREKIEEVLAHPGPVWCNVITPEFQLLCPRVASEKLPDGTMRSKPYDDMFPFLPREEYEANCLRLRD
jgi:acetolactate synthase-1/2/3 large subunit